MKCWMKLLVYFQTSTVKPLTVTNGSYVFHPIFYDDSVYLIMLQLKLVRVSEWAHDNTINLGDFNVIIVDINIIASRMCIVPKSLSEN